MRMRGFSVAVRHGWTSGRYYSPPLRRWLYWALIGGMSPFGARACDPIMARYNPAPARTGQIGR